MLTHCCRGGEPTFSLEAKRLGLLFSEQKGALALHPQHVRDIDDLSRDMSDGCGLISLHFARTIARHLDIRFEDKPYIPSVYQLRYLGYKGVVCVSRQLDIENKNRPKQEPKIHLHLRKDSMKKFTTTDRVGHSFSVVGHSEPFAFGRLNDEIVTLLSALQVTTETFLRKQRAWLDIILNAATDFRSCVLFLSMTNNLDLIPKAAAAGLEDKHVAASIRKAQRKEMDSHRKKSDDLRVRIAIERSRLLYGVCDDEGVLQDGEVFVRVHLPGEGVKTLSNVNVLVVRNPCLHPGDILILQAVNKPGIIGDIREECLVFATIGDKAPASLSSGGDLDGDKFFVCWDPDIVPSVAFQNYDYPPPPPRREPPPTRQSLIEYFCRYNTAALGSVKRLYLKWARIRGAGSSECQELNALHSDAVDGGRVQIPQRLRDPPSQPDSSDSGFILDVLLDDARSFRQNFLVASLDNTLGLHRSSDADMCPSVQHDFWADFLSSESIALSPYARLHLLLEQCTRHRDNPTQFLPFVNWDAFSTLQRHLVDNYLFPFYKVDSIWNSLLRSDILSASELQIYGLDRQLRLQRFYSSKQAGGMHNFFHRLEVANRYFKRLALVIQVGLHVN